MRPLRPSILLALALLGPRVSTSTARAAADGRVVPNDNRVPAGRVHGDTLTLALVARAAEWHPDGEAAPGVVMQAFAEEGGPARIPGPLVRVRAGTAAAVTVRNALGDTLRLRGLVDRTGAAPDTAALVVPPGARRTVRLRLDAPGTYLYWGTTTGRAINWRTGLDAQLAGALVVDPPGADPARPRDRVLVLGMWSDTVHRAGTRRARVLGTVNGRAWPHTGRLAYAEGDTVRLRVVNASADLHPMHLHGFHFRVVERTDALAGDRAASDAAALVVTESLFPATAVALEWVATRPGQWLFHCHIPEHFAPRGPLGTEPSAPPRHASGADHALGGMGGMVVGIAVAPRGRIVDDRSGGVRVDRPRVRAARALRLLVRAATGSTAAAPLYAYALHGPGTPEPPLTSGLAAAPVLDLVQGEPVEITVVNRLPEPTAVHWHGIELESYYDGVPGFSGSPRRTTPLVAPGDSFVVRFAPPRAGTFIYHTHADELRQQTAGLVGALVVRPPGPARDPAADVPIVVTSPVDFALNRRVVLFNASTTPAPLVLTAGRTYRLRLIQMSVPRAAVTLELRGRGAAGADSVLAWRLVAKDGADLPGHPGSRLARQFLGVGETADVEITPTAPGDLRLEARFGLAPSGVPVGPVVVAGTYPIHVRADAGAP